MKILAVADEVSPVLYSHTVKENFGEVDLILGCGDLPFYYYEFLVSSLNVPLYYVLGNHVRKTGPGGTGRDMGQEEYDPAGLGDLDRRITDCKGLLIGGFEGSPRYNLNPGPQYTELDIRFKTMKMWPYLCWNRLVKGRFIDILITHAPPWGIHDLPDPAHRGFKRYLRFMERYRPRYLIHGHTHRYDRNQPRVSYYEDTCVINAYGYTVFDIEVK